MNMNNINRVLSLIALVYILYHMYTFGFTTMNVAAFFLFVFATWMDYLRTKRKSRMAKEEAIRQQKHREKRQKTAAKKK